MVFKNLGERSAEFENTCDAAFWLIRRKYLYKYIQMRPRKKTIIVIIIIIMNNYDSKNDKLRW